MIATHGIKVNGVWYKAGEEIPQPVTLSNVEKTEFSKKIEKQYNKTVINRMSTAELKDLARENDIDDELTGAELKKALIAKFGL